jgi:hypothetical protein
MRTRFVEIRSYNLKPGTREEFDCLMVDVAIPMLREWKVDVVTVVLPHSSAIPSNEVAGSAENLAMIRSWTFLSLGAASGAAGLWMLLQSQDGGVAGFVLVLVSFVCLGRVVSRPGNASPPRQLESDDFVSDAEEWRALFRSLGDWKLYREIVVSVGTALLVAELFAWRDLWDTIRRYLPWLAGVLPPGGETRGVAVLTVSVGWLLTLVRTVTGLVTHDSAAR